MIKNLLSRLNFQNKLVACAGCNMQLRVPVRSGKRLRVTCPKCRTQFEVRFSNPVKELLKVRSFQQLKWQFNALPGRAKLSVVFLVISVLLMLYSVVGSFTKKHNSPRPETHNELRI